MAWNTTELQDILQHLSKCSPLSQVHVCAEYSEHPSSLTIWLRCMHFYRESSNFRLWHTATLSVASSYFKDIDFLVCRPYLRSNVISTYLRSQLWWHYWKLCTRVVLPWNTANILFFRHPHSYSLATRVLFTSQLAHKLHPSLPLTTFELLNTTVLCICVRQCKCTDFSLTFSSGSWPSDSTFLSGLPRTTNGTPVWYWTYHIATTYL